MNANQRIKASKSRNIIETEKTEKTDDVTNKRKTEKTRRTDDVTNKRKTEKTGKTDDAINKRKTEKTEKTDDAINKRNTGNTTKTAVLIGLMAAVICVVGPLSIPLPVSPVPISLTSLAVFLAVYVLGMKNGSISYLIYLLIGFVGLPVFSSFSAGPGVMLGPTGGYLIGFIFMAAISGLFIEKWITNRYLCFTGMVFGMMVCYLFGTMWLSYQAGISFYAALATGVVPFIPGDLAKIIIAAIVAPKIRKRLNRAGVIQESM